VTRSARGHPFFYFDFDVSSIAPDRESVTGAIFTLFDALLDLDELRVNPSTLKCFLRNLGGECSSVVPFHNFHHAWCVTQFTAAIYWNCFFKDQPTPGRPVVKAVFASLIAAASHDAGHDGFNNMFHIRTQSMLAKSSFNQSPLEHHHFSVFMHVLGINGCNVFENWSPEMRDMARNIIFNTILATDMKHHAAVARELLSKEKEYVAPEVAELLRLFRSGEREGELEYLEERFQGDTKGRIVVERNDPAEPITVLYGEWCAFG